MPHQPCPSPTATAPSDRLALTTQALRDSGDSASGTSGIYSCVGPCIGCACLADDDANA